MNRSLTAALMCTLALAAGTASAQDAMKKDSMKMDKPMTMQECKDMMAMKKDGMKKDEMMMKKESMCSDMMKKDGMMKPADGMASAPMKK